MLEVLARAADAEMVGLRTPDESGAGLGLIASYATKQEAVSTFANFTLPLSNPDCPISRGFLEQIVLVIGDSAELDRPMPDYYSPFSRSLLICPVWAGEKVVGVLGFSSSSVDNFNSETVELMTAITSVIGVLMENAKLQEERMLGDQRMVRLAQALDSAADAIALVDEHGNLEYMNKAAQEMTGDAAVDDPDDSMGFHGARGTNRSDGVLLQALDGGWSGEVQQLDLRGNSIDISLSTNKVTDDNNLVNGLITVARDVTERRRMERDLLRLNEDREVEANIGRIVSSPLDMSDVLERFSEEFSKMVSFDRLSIVGVDLEQKVFLSNFLYLADERTYYLNVGETYTATVAGTAVESGRPVVFHVGDAKWPTDVFERVRLLREAGQTAFMGVPLVSQDKIVGALAMSREGAPYTAEDQERATRVGNLISGALAGHILQQAKERAEADSRENESLFRQIPDNFRGGFWLYDLRSNKVIYVSPSAEQIWGIPMGTLYQDSRSWIKRMHPEDHDRVEKAAEVSMKTGAMYEEFRIIREDGSERWIANSGFPIRNENGKVYRMCGFIEVITERKEAENRLAEAERMAYIGELSAGVAHEINNPLTSIMLYSQMMLDEDLPDSISNDLHVVSSQAYRAAKIVRSLLHFARKSDPELRPLSIAGLIQRSLEMKSHEFQVNEIAVVENIPVAIPLIMMDEHLTIQVLLNVLTNAEQACVSAHGRGEITVSVIVEDAILRVSIRDDGPGIPEDLLGKIFDPFYTTKEVGSGTGLGLSVSMGILSQHSGRIWAESTEGAGTTFHIDLPAPIDVAATDWDFDPHPSTAAADARTARHILVVDDEQDLRAILVKQFEIRRYNVDQAGDGEEAWRKLQTLEYDCILLDLRMPGMSGQELYLRIKAEFPRSVGQIIFITGDIVNPATKEFLSEVGNPVLSKPFDFRELEQLVLSITNRQDGDVNPLTDRTDSILRSING
ncbi:MAG: PAS domain S-box protein [Chloroflexi bacterium]|nr:PAS domain S-box protein [Chloroflexota bacterium]